MKVEQQEACRYQVQTALDQLRHEHVLDKRKAINEALQLAQKQQQRAEQEQLQQQNIEQQKQFAHKQLLKHWRQRSQQQKTEQQAEQQQLDSVNQQQQQLPKQQQQQQQQQLQLLEKEPSQHRLKKQQQEQWQQQSTDPVQLPHEQSLQQQQQNSQQKQFEEHQLQSGIRHQQPVQRQSRVLRDVQQQQRDIQLPGTSSQQDVKHVLQQSLQNKSDSEHPLKIAQDVAEPKQQKADEQAPMVNEERHPNQQSGLNMPRWQRPKQQQPQQPLVFQAPAPANVNVFVHTADSQLVKHGLQAPLPNWKQQNIDVDRQQQFEQLKQDKLREQLQTQKGLCFFIDITLVNCYNPREFTSL